MCCKHYDTHLTLLPNVDRIEAELDELSDSDESTKLPKPDLTDAPAMPPLGIRGGGGVRSF